MAGLQERFKEQMPSGSVFPDKFKFIDISLINDGSEKGILQAEYVFFGGKSSDNPTPYAAYPSSGTYHPLPSFTVTSTKKTAQVQGQFWWWNIMPLLSGAQTSHVGELADKISTWMKTDNTGGGRHALCHLLSLLRRNGSHRRRRHILPLGQPGDVLQ
jgi:hypothetical protein